VFIYPTAMLWLQYSINELTTSAVVTCEIKSF